MLDYVLRIRDVVHGTILFTREEMDLINHPFFQRLRQIRQNDVAFYVYPSMNASRFEHVLGVCRVAGMMAETLTKSPKWEDYFKALKTETGIRSKKDFVRLARLYALLHDIGHFPLSHLFEHGLESWTRPNYLKAIEEWTGFKGFKKLHEAFGALLTEKIIKDVRIPKNIGESLLRLMGGKTFLPIDPLCIVKSVVDSDIDADRIDFVQRDGLAAGGEYGHYDVRRLCDSVFIEQDESGWLIVYSEKALTSMEALLLDRYKVYTWINFHHRVVVMRMMVSFLIMNAIEHKAITKEHFNPENVKGFSLKDDIWLWNTLRNIEPNVEFTAMVQRAVFHREKENILNLWKTRPDYHELHERVKDKLPEEKIPDMAFEKTYAYEVYISFSVIGGRYIRVLLFNVHFNPIGEKEIWLYSEAEEKISGKSLKQVSKLVARLEEIWEDEPKYSLLFVDSNIKGRAEEIKEKWVDKTVYYIENLDLFQGRTVPQT